jgi:hypothetical protein
MLRIPLPEDDRFALRLLKTCISHEFVVTYKVEVYDAP